MGRPSELRQLIRSGPVLAAGVYNALFAKVAEQVGFKAIYVTGFGTAARYGFADVGLVTQTEMVDNLRYICAATTLPVIADADTGYGGMINARRTVGEYERAGVAGMHIEDQVFPKKCGFMEGKQVIDMAEAGAKVRAACDARTDPDFLIIARTDALAVNGWDDTVARAKHYRECGADMVFVDGIRTEDELRTYSERIASTGIPSLYNGSLVSVTEAAKMGFQLQILAGLALGAVYTSANEAMAALKADGSAAPVVARYQIPGDPGLNEALGLSSFYEEERKYAVAVPA
jgi:2-methylisocitrate lyase-like PEP mutase family enzyme